MINKNIIYDFSISSYCNAACPSCKRYGTYSDPIPRDSSVDPNQKLHPTLRQLHIEFDDFKEVIEKNIHIFKGYEVTFEGELGDAMVHPRVQDFIDYGCSIFRTLKIITNGGNRKPDFYEELGTKYKNLEMFFSIDGMRDDTNLYRKRVRTERALSNMTSFANSKHGWGNTYWQFLLFNHNFFEVPDALSFAKMNNIMLHLKFNQRPKFLISKKRKQIATNLYEKHKHELSSLTMGS